MITQLVHFVRAFAARYDGDPRLTAVQTGLLGLWGEWHQSGCETLGPSNAVKQAVRDAYLAFFTNTPVQTRYPRDPDSMHTRFGFHEDYFPSFTAPCIYGFPECNDSGDWNLWYCYTHVNPAAASNWLRNPISGESPLPSQKRAWSTHWESVMTVIRDYHFSFLGPAGGHEYHGNQGKLNAMKRLLGYNYHIVRVDWPASHFVNSPIPVVIALTNSGAAPCYHPFRLEFALCLSNGTPVARFALTNNLRDLVPGALREWPVLLPPTNIPPGRYSLRVGILDPRTGEPGVRIQSEGEDAFHRIVIGDIWLISSLSDADGDGLPDEWELRYFGNSTNAVPEKDSDGDGQSNWEHFISGTNPLNAHDFFRISDMAIRVTTAVVRVEGRSNRLYRLYGAEMPEGPWVLRSATNTERDGQVTLTDPNPTLRPFYRVSVEREHE